MLEQLKLKQLIKELKQVFEEFPDARTGKNSQYEMTDAGLGAFSVFFIQCASFLEHQEEMKRTKGRSNAESLFEIWKVENENNNVLTPALAGGARETKGYHLEHNFGHGHQHLSSLLLSLNLLAFLFHTVLGLVDEKYRLLRQALRKRQKFFQDMETLLQYLLFDSWDDLFSFMCKGLELDTS